MGSVKLVLLLGCLVFVVVRGADKVCNVLPGQQNDPCSFVDKDERQHSVLDDENECKKHKDYCCWKRGKCNNKIVGTGELPEPPEKKNPFKKPNSAKVKGSLSRFLPLGGSCLPKLPFPAECNFSKNERYVLEPPTIVPYCVRIPCSLDRAEQRGFDHSHFKCGSYPGCYFDVELYEYRDAFGPAVLAGVPVCQLAIRSAVFHREAQTVIASQGAWNPFFTNCLLNKFKEEIAKGPEGCKLIPLLRAFKINPKLAGWEGITEFQCVLIGGCWSDYYGCTYPVDINNLVVKSGQRFKFNRFEVIYGRPKCQHFNSENSYEILKSYHRCLSSGCSVDLNIVAKYYHYLYDIGDQMTPEDHWDFWDKATSGIFKPNNLDEGIHWEWDRTFKRSLKPAAPDAPRRASTTPSQNSVFGIPVLGRRKRNTRSQAKKCGFVYRVTGGRPCRPPQVPNFNLNSYCPYKPFYVPRFKRLKGSFKGCCDINYCYLSISDIRKMHSGPAKYYTEWSGFDMCSVTCGGGTQLRTRNCVAHDEILCTDKTKETRPCGMKFCPFWGPWTPWSQCPRLCPGGKNPIHTRTRQCVPKGAYCQGLGPGQEVATCRCRG